MIFKKQFQDIEWNDIDLLISSEQLETEHLEYKREVPGNSDSNKKELLADICSFANSDGGFLIYGIGEDRASGKPAIQPFGNLNAETNRIEQIITTGITPRLISYKVKAITPQQNSDGIIIIKIEKSWIGPHMVSVEQVNKFWIRKQSGKFPMDYNEIKTSFLVSGKIEDRVREFCNSRELALHQQSTVRSIKNERSLMLHVVPLSTFSHRLADIQDLKNDNHLMMPLSQDSTSWRINLDGFSRSTVSDRVESYVQVFWDFTHEFADSFIMESYNKPNEVFIGRIGIAVSKALRISFENMERLNIHGPKVIILRLNGLKNVALVNTKNNYEAPREFDRARIVLPDILDADGDHLKIAGQLMNSLANAAGYEKALLVENGVWTAGEDS